jgi:sugar phosphate isomerase/epimerase
VIDGLIAAYWTLAGAPFGQPARWSCESRVRAAAEAGFAGIGMHYEDYLAMRERGAAAGELRRLLDAHTIVVDEIEFLSGWSSDDAAVQVKAREAEDALYALADEVGARQLNVGCSELVAALVPLERMAERFAGVCERADRHGLVVAIEFMPWTGIPDVSEAA